MVLNLFASWDEEDQAGNALSTSVPAARGENDLRIEGFLSSDRIEPGGTVVCWLIVQNMGDHPVKDVKLTNWNAAGFEPPIFTPRNKNDLDVAAKDFFRVDGVLRARSVPQRFRATAEFSWRDGNVRRVKEITLGPIAIRGATQPRVYAVSRRAVGLLKDLALPILAALLTYWFTTKQNESQFQQSAQNIMLTKSHENMEKHYAPLATFASIAASRLTSMDPSVSDTVHEALFYLLMFLKRERIRFLKIGAFYLASRRGEDIVRECTGVVLRQVTSPIGLAARTAAVSKMTTAMEFWDFEKDAAATSEVVIVRDLLINWATTEKRQTLQFLSAVLTIYKTVLTNEINLPQRLWYANETFEPLPDLADVLPVLELDRPDLAGMYRDYLKFSSEAWKDGASR